VVHLQKFHYLPVALSLRLHTPSTFTAKQIANAVYLAVLVFFTYASIFAFRKPFTVATFDGLKFWNVSYQTLLIISQVVGYMLSKFYGIKFISELQRHGRWKTSLLMVGVAWLSLLLFAVVPAPWGMLCFFINGFTLGFMWGVVFSYVEGRRATDFIGVVLAVSFIFAGGFSRSVGKWLILNWNVTEYWMPFATATLFAVPLVLFYFFLEKTPLPDSDDVAERTIRLPMNKPERSAFLKQFKAGVVAFVIIYLLLTIMRDLRDNYMANMWNELGYAKNASVFAKTETITSLIVLGLIGMMVFVRKNIRAFRIIHYLLILGFAVAGISSLLFKGGFISGAEWMQFTGLGLYIAYVLFNSVFFERLLASFSIAGNVGFLIYMADAWGYLGSITVMLSKELFKLQLNWVSFYSQLVIVFAVVGVVASIFSLVYFAQKHSQLKPAE
jgi:MFS family permease